MTDFFPLVQIPAENMLSAEGSGFTLAMKGLDGGRINIATCSVGGAQACLDAAKDHVKTRKQFGKPLADLQNVQFKLADMATELTAARLMVRQAADLVWRLSFCLVGVVIVDVVVLVGVLVGVVVDVVVVVVSIVTHLWCFLLA